jgi:hypothetical protein
MLMHRKILFNFLFVFSTLLLLKIPVLAYSDGSEWEEIGGVVGEELDPTSGTLPGVFESHSAVVYDGKMWLIGGWFSEGSWVKNRVYYSSDGTIWNRANDLPLDVTYHTSVVYDNKMWVIGGTSLQKVFYSSDGVTWTEAGSDSLPFAISSHSSVVFDNKMWILGVSDQVFYSTDGITWNEAGSHAFPSDYGNGVAYVFDNKMWFAGGYDSSYSRKVYYSTDGITWTEAGTDALPVALEIATGVTYHDEMWFIGGQDGSDLRREVYHSSDGITWTEAGTDALPLGVAYSEALVYNDRMWVFGGEMGIGWDASKKVFASVDNVEDPINDPEITVTNSFRKDNKCRYETPPETTWIKFEPMEKDGVWGMHLTWVQYNANKVTIKMDDGTGNFPWSVNRTLNDGHEFLPSVESWQNIKIRPINHCKKGYYSAPINYISHPYGWFNE